MSSCVRALTTLRCSSQLVVDLRQHAGGRLAAAVAQAVRQPLVVEAEAWRVLKVAHPARSIALELVGFRLRLALLAAQPLGDRLIGTELIAALGHPHFVLQRGIVVKAGAARRNAVAAACTAASPRQSPRRH